MSYVLSSISSDDKKKIIQESRGNKNVYPAVSSADKYKQFPEKWAIDRENNSYLLLSPVLERNESLNRKYIMCYLGRIYSLVNIGGVGNRFVFEDDMIPNLDKVDDIKINVASAFSVFGRWGLGTKNKEGREVYAVIPEFVERS